MVPCLKFYEKMGDVLATNKSIKLINYGMQNVLELILCHVVIFIITPVFE